MSLNRSLLLLYTLLTCMPAVLPAQEAEQQISFARESRPHSYYVQQAELWWRELEKDRRSESNWYNYFRACRNAHGTADWRTDFVDESPFLRRGADIVQLMQRNIPTSFTYYYLSYLNEGIGTEMGPNLLLAYQMNPDFEGIRSSVISYAESSLNPELRQRVNAEWFRSNEISPQLLTYAYNVLSSLGENALLLTQHDNDTYPIWMLQDALDIRADVTVINIDFLLLGHYRNYCLDLLKIPSRALDVQSVDDYHRNWESMVMHILSHYNHDRPLYLGMTINKRLYRQFADRMTVSGLAFRFAGPDKSLIEFNKSLFKEYFLLDYLTQRFTHDRNQGNIDYQNLNYLKLFKILYDEYSSEANLREAGRIKQLAVLLLGRIDNPDYKARMLQEFN